MAAIYGSGGFGSKRSESTEQLAYEVPSAPAISEGQVTFVDSTGLGLEQTIRMARYRCDRITESPMALEARTYLVTCEGGIRYRVADHGETRTRVSRVRE